MEHLSYYPIDVSDGLEIGDATFIFYNDKIETSEVGSGNTDSANRTTRGASQHYLMHSGLFRNVSSTLTTSGDIHFKGSVGVGSTGSGNSLVTYSGVLINGTLSGTLTTSNSKEIVFEGLTISDTSKYLFINQLTTNSKMTLSGVRTGGGKDFSNVDKSSTETKYTAGATVASSLIGDVSGNGIQISFDRMKLDSRSTAGSPADWSAQYGTTKSIFSGATFLNKFAVDDNSTGKYDFAENLDWTGTVHDANVTYGMEIRTSKEYEDKQQRYFRESEQTNYVDPVNSPSLRTAVYPFNSGFLPYVKESTAIRNSVDPTSNNYAISKYDTREIKVNVYTAGLPNGCGTYNHPYEIAEGSELITLAESINKKTYFSTLRLPKINCNNDSNLTNLNDKIKNHWCENKAGCAIFTHNDSLKNYTYTEGRTTYTWTEDQVSLYLASAYYIVKNDISITGTFSGLGASPASDTTGKYAFRGVIVGAKDDGSVKISMSVPKTYGISENTNFENTSGLITMSNGCVVKNLTIEVTPYSSDKYNYYVKGNQAYGYDEKLPNYGAVINKIMGGDNIIDNVSVQFTDSFKVKSGGEDYKATVGGYVGCVVNGGLIFRNVDDDSLTNFVVKKVDGSNGTVQTVTVNKEYDEEVTDKETGEVSTVHHTTKSITNLTDEDDLIHIHINPFVGRVINGYAIRESSTVKKTVGEEEKTVETAHYAFSEDGATYGDGETRANAEKVTMHNTRKNYSIPDIDTTKNFQDNPTSVLTFTKETGETTYNTITVPDGQALYIMSIIAQSGSGCATSETNKYAYNISYCGDSNNRSYAGTEKNNNKATHLALYSDIGEDQQGDDYLLSVNDTVNKDTCIPYIIYKYTSSYTSGTTTYYPARTLTKRTFYVNLIAGTTYYLPDCFRGIGFLGSNEYVNDNMKIYGFNGNGAIIDLNAEYFTNKKSEDTYFGGHSIGLNCGIALFNSLQQFTSDSSNNYKYESDSKYQITNFTLQGYISAHHVSSTNGSDENASHSGNITDTHFTTAGFVAIVLNSNIKLFNFSNIDFKSFHVNSYSWAGGFIAYTNTSSVRIYINNCNANGYKIEGCGRVGGFVGSYDSQGSSEGGIHINTGLDSNGKDTFTSVMKNTIINNRSSATNKSNYSAGIIGSVWCNTSGDSNKVSTTDQGDHALGTLILRNVTIEGGNAETNYIGNKDNPSGSSAGIMGGGTTNVKGCLIQNCVVKDIDIYGRYAGGIMGENANRASSSSATGARIVGCKVTGKLDSSNNPQYTIMALQYAGGVYGDTRDNGKTNPKYKSLSAGDTALVEYKTDIDGVYVYGYNIYSINEENKNESDIKSGFGAGGITGNNEEARHIQNCKVEKCVIDVGTSASSATNTPCAGLIGRINSGTIYGYNIEVKDCDFYTHQWNKTATIAEGQTMIEARATNTQKAYSYSETVNGVTTTQTPVSGMKCGNVVGNGNSKNVNITAIHVEDCPAETDFNSVSGSSFIIYADYNDVASGSNHGETMSTLSVLSDGYSNVGEGGLTEFFPHVNVSPVIQMGEDTILTGDGAALYDKSVTTTNNEGQEITKQVKTPVIDAIVNDSNYNTASSATKTYIQNALSTTAVNGQPNKISTFKNEMGELPDGVDDFTVLVINSETRTYSTDFINHYIQMVTNTSHDFMKKTNQEGKYKINVYPCTYDENNQKYVINASGKSAGLEAKETTGAYEYFMRNTHADSNQGDYQFSLMDVQFYNPNNTLKEEVVYHLYIPVLTKKMLMFEFRSASESGTDNKAVNFTGYGNTLAESLESWYTGYLHFTYSQTELQSILESGSGLNWNSPKTVQFLYQSDSVDAKLGDDTQFVLCDPNKNDQHYYATLADLRPEDDDNGESDSISFGSFATTLNTGDSSRTIFTPATLNQLLLSQGFKITAKTTNTPGDSGFIYKLNTSEDDVVDVIDSDGNKYHKVEENGTVELTISYSVTDENGETTTNPAQLLEENYYLAVRAVGDSVYNYSIRTPATISGGSGKPTLRRSNAEEGYVTNVIMGSLYEQTVSIDVKNNDGSSVVINAENHRLDVTLNSTIKLTGKNTDKDYILGHLTNENIHLYQAFIINLTAYDTTGNRSDILGVPNVTTN